LRLRTIVFFLCVLYVMMLVPWFFFLLLRSFMMFSSLVFSLTRRCICCFCSTLLFSLYMEFLYEDDDFFFARYILHFLSLCCACMVRLTFHVIPTFCYSIFANLATTMLGFSGYIGVFRRVQMVLGTPTHYYNLMKCRAAYQRNLRGRLSSLFYVRTWKDGSI
jgi:hypothetical protein